MSNEAITASPLSWPTGWRRSKQKTEARFNKSTRVHMSYGSYDRKTKLSVKDGIDRVMEVLNRMNIPDYDVIISTNLALRNDGLPRSGQAEPEDSGAAVYWKTRKGDQRCMAIDQYTRVADNLAAIAGTLDAMRRIERYGGADILDRAFTGFVALPSPEQWWHVLGYASPSDPSGPDEVNKRYRNLANRQHPDKGGRARDMATLNWARGEALRAVAS